VGQLKTGILNLHKVMMETAPKIQNIQETLDSHSDPVMDLSGECRQGYKLLYLYLDEKLKKIGSNPDALPNRRLKDIMDANIAQSIKGIQQWIHDIKAEIASLNAAQQNSYVSLVTTVDSADALANQLKAAAAKKMVKWSQDIKYKEKIKTYFPALDTLALKVKQQKAGVTAARSLRLTDDWVDGRFAISPDTTVALVKDRASMDLAAALQNY